MFIKTSGGIDRVVIPVRGFGLWARFTVIWLKATSVPCRSGLLQHKETPGLGGEVENLNGSRAGKGALYDDGGQPAVDLVMRSPANSDASRYEVMHYRCDLHYPQGKVL